MTDRATFRASLPNILSCIKVSGDGGARLQLDVPDSDMAEALKVLLWRGCVLRVTVEPENRRMQEDAKIEHDMAEGTERQPRWAS